MPYNTTIAFKLQDLSFESAVGDSVINSFDANNRPATTTIRVDTTSAFYMDATPTSSSEFDIVSMSASLGGGSVNVGRFGSANTVAAASGYDFLSLVLHEIEHSIGFSSGTVRWNNVISGGGSVLAIPASLSGLPGSFNVPISGTHIDGTAQNGLFNDTTIALPGFNPGERALLTGVDILGVCRIEGCTASQYNLEPSATIAAVPEPGTWALMLAGLAGAVGFGQRRRRLAARNG